MNEQTQEKILIIDDEADIGTILKLHLEESGYLTEWARDGEAGLAMLMNDDFSLVLLDIRMPRISGVDVLHRVRAAGSDVAVIMMTAHGSESLAVECMRTGAQDYVAKPFDMNDLLQRVERALANRQTLLVKQRLEQEKQDFVSMLSHDLKNPITAVIGSIDIMREGRLGPVNSEQAEYLESAIDSCNEVVGMIDNLLDIHRFEAGRMPMNVRPCSLQEIITAIRDRFTLLAQREEVTLTVEQDQSLPTMFIDRIALTRVIANLLGNACKFTPPNGVVRLSCRVISGKAATDMSPPAYASAQRPELFDQEQLLCITVQDTGEGIPAEDHERIFERFAQSQPSGRGHGGAGLGLAYCKLAVNHLGGIIWVSSTLGTGSEFVILLPCQEGQKPESTAKKP